MAVALVKERHLVALSESWPREREIEFIQLHHAVAPWLAGILALFAAGGRVVSANVAIGEGRCVETVEESRRAFTSGSWVDDASVTSEIANATPLEAPWAIRDVDFDLTARWIADVATRHGIPIDDAHVITHREILARYGVSYATECPGDWMQDRKAELLALARRYQEEMNMTSWADFWGSPWRRSNPYGARAPIPGVYSKGYHRGEDIANDGKTCDVPALRRGEIIDSGRSGSIGFWVCIKPEDAPHQRDIYCHLYEPTARESGWVTTGQVIGRTAGWGENPGTGWSGPHLHFVVSSLSDGGHNTDRPDYDPRPIIANALAQSAGKDDDMSAKAESQIDELWQRLLPGTKDVKHAGDAYLTLHNMAPVVKTAAADAAAARKLAESTDKKLDALLAKLDTLPDLKGK